MTANTHQDDVPRWAATAGSRCLAQRIAAHGPRLFSSSRRRPADRKSSLSTEHSEVTWEVRQRVLREYHTATLLKARHASEELVRAGFNTGAVPYGYRAQRVQVSPPGRRPRWRTRLVMEPVEAATVKMIFAWRGANGSTIDAIYERLIAARYPAPLDPETEQLGHKRKDIDDLYSHVTDPMIEDTLAALQRRWEQDGGWSWSSPVDRNRTRRELVHDRHGADDHDPTWRHAGRRLIALATPDSGVRTSQEGALIVDPFEYHSSDGRDFPACRRMRPNEPPPGGICRR